jgi:hypothetical protein
MEKLSKLSWTLVGVRPTEGSPDGKLEEETIQKMLNEAFEDGKTYDLFLCGEVVQDKKAALPEMEDGYFMLKAGMPELEYGDYGIISSHEEGDLLFVATELDEETISQINAQDISGNTNIAQA